MTSFPGSDIIVAGIFLLFIATTITGAIMAALSTRVIRGVCGLAMCCLGLAGLFYFLRSPFLALMEILIYVGAVCVTIVFAVMLAEPEEAARTPRDGSGLLWTAGAFILSALIFGALAWLGLAQKWTVPATRLSDGSVKVLGVALLTTYSLVFELISLVLLVAILGALVIARPGRTKT